MTRRPGAVGELILNHIAAMPEKRRERLLRSARRCERTGSQVAAVERLRRLIEDRQSPGAVSPGGPPRKR